MSVRSPYEGKKVADWNNITNGLLNTFPVSRDEIVKVSLDSWNDIFESKIGKNEYKIGVELFPNPQILGFFLHELIPLNLAKKYTFDWKKGTETNEKDLVYIKDDRYSCEIKTSSHPTKIFGNRSYAQKSENSKKDKSGYYLAINFDKVSENSNARIKRIRFGWIDSEDWRGQAAQTGQQAHLTAEAERNKLILIYNV